MVASGGTVKVKPGTYNERVHIDRGVTLEGSDLESGSVIISQILTTTPAPATVGVIQIQTTDPVVIRDLKVRQDNIRGVNALFRGVDLTVERVSFDGISNISPIVGNGVSVTNNAGLSLRRARLVVRESRFSVGGVGIVIGGDVDALVEGNEVEHVRSRAVCVIVNPTGQGAGATVPAGALTNVEIKGNLFSNCGTDALRFAGRGFNAIAIQGALGAETRGFIRISGNTFRTTDAIPGAPDACPTSAILFEFYSGVIERNVVSNVVRSCAVVGPRNSPGAIFVGSLVKDAVSGQLIRAADVVVRFNDFGQNAIAGLRIGSNQRTSLDATCNWWGDPTGPADSPDGIRDRVLVDAGGADPQVLPFAARQVAGTTDAAC
jgi:hypothetical protein